MTDIPEEIMARARECVADIVGAVQPHTEEYVDAVRRGKHDDDLRHEIEITASAILAAEKRGAGRMRERAAQVARNRHIAWDWMDECPVNDDVTACEDIAAAIRALEAE